MGSTTGKAAILDESGSIVSTTIVPSEIDPEITSIQALEKACAQVADLNSYKDLVRIVGTGYGRNEVAFADENISEISCHAMGTFYCNRDIKTIVDIGGQDVKTIAIADDGSVLEFAMNDKCAAGTGRFLEAIDDEHLGVQPDPDRHAVELAVQFRKDQSHGARRAGRGGDHGQGGSPGPPEVLVRKIEQSLITRV